MKDKPRVRKMRREKTDPKRSAESKRETRERDRQRRAKRSAPGTWNGQSSRYEA